MSTLHLAAALTFCRSASIGATAPARLELNRAIACLEAAEREWAELNARTYYLAQARKHVLLAISTPVNCDGSAGGIPLAAVAPGQLYGSSMRRAA